MPGRLTVVIVTVARPMHAEEACVFGRRDDLVLPNQLKPGENVLLQEVRSKSHESPPWFRYGLQKEPPVELEGFAHEREELSVPCRLDVF